MQDPPDNTPSSTIQYFPAAASEATPIVEVLRSWQRIEPRLYPIRFGIHVWGRDTPEEHSELLTYEFAAAIDALAERLWPFDLNVNMAGKSEARVAFANGRIATATDVDPLAAFIRATVHALVLQPGRERSKHPLVLAVSSDSAPVTSDDNEPRVTPPADDVRAWSRLEPHRFNKGSQHYTAPLYRGAGLNVLAPAFRAKNYIHYATAPSVFESADLHGWTTRLAGTISAKGKRVYHATVNLPEGRTASGTYATPGPATVKAYLEALKAASADRISTLPQPKALYSYPLLVIHTNEKYWFPIAGRGEPRYAHATGTLVVPETYLSRPHDWPPDDLEILEREPTAEEIDRSAALGILPPR